MTQQAEQEDRGLRNCGSIQRKPRCAWRLRSGVAESIPAELLRVMSPSAEVQGHSPAERKLVSGKRDVTIQKIEPVGNYAVRLVFSDGHDTGLFTWPYLYDLAQRKTEHWDGYLKEIEAAGLSREPR